MGDAKSVTAKLPNKKPDDRGEARAFKAGTQRRWFGRPPKETRPGFATLNIHKIDTAYGRSRVSDSLAISPDD